MLLKLSSGYYKVHNNVKTMRRLHQLEYNLQLKNSTLTFTLKHNHFIIDVLSRIAPKYNLCKEGERLHFTLEFFLPQAKCQNRNISHLSVMSLENNRKCSMSYKIFLVINKFTNLFCHWGEEMMLAEDTNKRRFLRTTILWWAIDGKIEERMGKLLRKRKQKQGEDGVLPLLNYLTA